MIQKCETCRHWSQGDPSPRNLGNVGSCVALMPHTPGFYDHNKHTPFWAQQMSHLTASFDGGGCQTYKAIKPVKAVKS